MKEEKKAYLSRAKAYARRKEQKQREYEKHKAAKDNQLDRNKDNGSRLQFKPRKNNNSDVKIAVKRSRRGCT